jgi:hypothetical protein
MGTNKCQVKKSTTHSLLKYGCAICYGRLIQEVQELHLKNKNENMW